MWRVGAHQPAPRRVSWAGKHSKIKQQVTRDRMSATVARGGKQQQQHEERGRKLCYDGEDSDFSASRHASGFGGKRAQFPRQQGLKIIPADLTI